MPVDIAPVPLSEKAQLAAMMSDYMAEMAVILSIPLTIYRHFDLYWLEPGRRWPYWIVSDGERAGFALVGRDEAAGHFEIAEFYVASSFRRRGIGIAAARQLIKRYPGDWRITQREANPGGIAFWHRVLDGIQYQEITTSTDAVRREQTFTS